ncbi:hypothetical protein ACP4OV_008263 [Aristida adscensionis]
MAAEEPRKLFVGGLPRSVVAPGFLRSHFARYGEVVDAVVMVSPEDGRGRGFGFVEFADEAAALRALDEGERPRHFCAGRRFDVKRAQSRATQSTSYNPNVDRKKIFVGGLRDNITEEELRSYFQKFGVIADCVVMYDKITRRPRGFGFVRFHSQDAADKVLEKNFHDLNGTQVETKTAEPREYGRNQSGYYNGSMAVSYNMLYPPHNIPYFFHNGPYLVPTYPYMYTPQYGYVNQTTTNISMHDSYMVNPHRGRPHLYDPLSSNYLKHHGLDLETHSRMSEMPNQQKVDIRAPNGVKSDPQNQQKVDIAAPTSRKSDPQPNSSDIPLSG